MHVVPKVGLGKKNSASVPVPRGHAPDTASDDTSDERGRCQRKVVTGGGVA